MSHIFIFYFLDGFRKLFLSNESLNNSLSIKCSLFNIVPTFEYPKQRNIQLSQFFSHIEESIRSHSTLSQRIKPRCIKSTTNYQKFRLELFQYWFYDSVVKVNILVISRCLTFVLYVLFIIVI